MIMIYCSFNSGMMMTLFLYFFLLFDSSYSFTVWRQNHVSSVPKNEKKGLWSTTAGNSNDDIAPPPNPSEFLEPAETSRNYENSLMEYGTVVQRWAHYMFGLDTAEYYMEAASTTAEDADPSLYKLYLWDTDESDDKTKNNEDSRVRRFDARMISTYSYETDTFAWTRNDGIEKLPKEIIDRVMRELMARSRVDDENICPLGSGDILSEVVQNFYEPKEKPYVVAYEDNNRQQQQEEEQEAQQGQQGGGPGDGIAWLVSYLVLSKMVLFSSSSANNYNDNAISIYSTPIGDPVGSGRAWFLLSNFQPPSEDIQLPSQAIEYKSKTRQLQESVLSQRRHIFWRPDNNTPKKNDPQQKELSEAEMRATEKEEAGKRFLEDLFCLSPPPTLAVANTDDDYDTLSFDATIDNKGNDYWWSQLASRVSEGDFEDQVWQYGKQIQNSLLSLSSNTKYQLSTMDHFELIPAHDNYENEHHIYFYREIKDKTTGAGVMDIVQFRLHEICALVYSDNIFFGAPPPQPLPKSISSKNDSEYWLPKALKLLEQRCSNSNDENEEDKGVCKAGDASLFNLVWNALSTKNTSGGGADAGGILQLRDMNPDKFADSFEDMGWFLSFLCFPNFVSQYQSNNNNDQEHGVGVVSIPTENNENDATTGTIMRPKPGFSRNKESPGRAWYIMEDITTADTGLLLPSSMLDPSTSAEYEKAISHYSRIKSGMMGDLYDLDPDTNIYIDDESSTLYCWNEEENDSDDDNDNDETTLIQRKGMQFRIHKIGELSYPENIFTFPKDFEYKENSINNNDRDDKPEYTWLRRAIDDLEIRSKANIDANDSSSFIPLLINAAKTTNSKKRSKIKIIEQQQQQTDDSTKNVSKIGESIGWLLSSICLSKSNPIGLSILPDFAFGDDIPISEIDNSSDDIFSSSRTKRTWYIVSHPEHEIDIPKTVLQSTYPSSKRKKMSDLR